VVAVHFVGGWIGTLWIGIFGLAGISDAGESLIEGGSGGLLGAQAAGAAIATAWSFVVALVLGFVLKIVGLLRVAPEVEVEGIDVHQHKETAYDSSSGSSSGAVAGAHAGESLSV
jgi:Amt family ammonium transporter